MFGHWSDALWPAGVLWLALLVDHVWGEPPVRWHPVVWLGHYLGWAGQRIAPLREQAHIRRDWMRFGLGAAAWVVGALVVVALAVAVQQVLFDWHPAWSLPLLALLLKPLLAWRMLRTEVQAVDEALLQSLESGRTRLGWLVSRDVHALGETEVRESAIESLAENLNDSVVAPLFWFALLGLPGAALYRYANTADAMWGYRGVYRGREWEWAGKWAARADDALSWLPARLTALLLLLARGGMRFSALRREARRTPSPNSGWPMAAMAQALDVTLRKPGVYVLHERGRAVQKGDMDRAIHLATRVVVWSAVVLSLLGILVQEVSR